jgi:hypothetical protein
MRWVARRGMIVGMEEATTSRLRCKSFRQRKIAHAHEVLMSQKSKSHDQDSRVIATGGHCGESNGPMLMAWSWHEHGCS